MHVPQSVSWVEIASPVHRNRPGVAPVVLEVLAGARLMVVSVARISIRTMRALPGLA
ncbi:hypothetical protein ACIRQQ_38615 [Streptomyces fuscichromogenes]|uniref:hypothetical protein n=1 Tax=Streptomyces fuscichromogenes TaxID=1324013 RepID=UPI00381C7826